MFRKLLTVLFIALSSMTLAQDTTWVQTFSFDSISTRRANFEFPQELNSKRFEKVLMYYKLKCDPQTPWDQYNCGEWDYLAYTRIFDHTGVMDSVQVDSVQYLNNFNNSGTFDYDNWGYNYKNTYEVNEHIGIPSLTLGGAVTSVGGTSNYPFDQSTNGGRYQMLVTSGELAAAGLVAGDIVSLNLDVVSIIGSGELMHPRISIKGTPNATIQDFDQAGFTEVYDLSRDGVNTSLLATGNATFGFYQPFNWNGTDNLIIEFSFDNGVQPTNTSVFNSEGASTDLAVNYPGKNGVLEFDGTNYAMLELSDYDFGSDITISFWAKGLGNTGVNTSVLEAEDTLNDRAINIHFPWSNNRVYWDCGDGNGYDRIDTDMSGNIDNDWHHWAFIKDQTTGEMKIMLDGALFHSGTGLTRDVGYMHRLILGANKNLANNWTGMIDEFQVFDTALPEATVTSWYDQKVDAGHPNWNDLIVYYTFDNEKWAVDESQNSYLLMPSEKGMIDFNEYPVAGVEVNADRPVFSLYNGSITPSDVYVDREELLEPDVVFEFAQVDHHFEIVNAFLGLEEGAEETYDFTGTMTSSTPFVTNNTISNQTITYYEEPYEVVNDVEIGRFITPYGIQFDLGSQGFNWIYDVTDYQMYLKDTVDLAAHNTQELIDLRFAFIEGIPPRDVHKREPIWSDWRSYRYDNLDNDVDLPATTVVLGDTSEMFKIKTRFTGHGHNGNVNCCEWDSKDHMISIDGVERFNWEIWEETACGDNPNVSQGGTWPYAREGWCPGDLVKEYDHELTPYVTAGSSVQIDYDIEDIPVNDQAQGAGNYVVAMDLISYSAPNFQNDAAIIDIYNPNSWEYYGKWNPSCQNPRVILQNTGEQPLTSCKINVWVDYGHPVTFDWTGNLEFLEKEVVEIPIMDYSFWYDYNNSGTFSANVNYIQNTWGLDEYEQNNTKTVQFDAPESINGQFEVWFQTNNKAWENKWKLMDSEGNTIFERTSLSNSTTYRDTFDLAPGCYSILLEDNDNDGIYFWYSNQVEGESSGSFNVKLIGGPIVEYFEKDFGNFHQYNFTVGFDLGIDDLGDLEEELMVYPNPNNGLFNVEISGNIDFDARLEIIDLMGRSVLSEKMNAKVDFASSQIDLQEVPAGHYIVKVITANGVYTEEFVKH